MGFYIDWNQKKQNGEVAAEYINSFIKADHRSIESLNIVNEKELSAAYSVLHETPLADFLQEIKILGELPVLKSYDIPCFSNMENGASRLNELLSFAPNGLTFSEIGYQLINSVGNMAQTKYGENQSKLAEMMSLVKLSDLRPTIVKSTAWGDYLIRYTFSEKKEVLKKLLLRSPCVQTMLCLAFRGLVSYNDVVSFLSFSTKIRRRTNVKYLVNFILEESEYKVILSNIDWEVN